MQVTELRLFCLPVYKVKVPGLEQFHDEIVELFEGLIRSGKLKPHANGYGYQTPTDLFQPGAYDQRCFSEVLLPSFLGVCHSILQRTRVAPPPRHEWSNTLAIGWANVQTSETFAQENPWHDHLPATLSGCYYVSTATSSDEGNLQFLSPLMENIFIDPILELTPEPGEMIVFPSFLRHRPDRCPNTQRTRVSLCMDSHWTLRPTPARGQA